MIYKGRVIDIAANYAVVLTDGMEYKRIIKKNSMRIGMPIMFLKEDIYSSNRLKVKALYGIAALFIFMIVSALMFSRANNIENLTASVVSIDINPSIELYVNQNDVVTLAKAYNNEGNSLLKETPIGLDLSETVLQILNKAYEAHYLDLEDSTVLIAFAALNPNTSKELIRQQETIRNIISSSMQLKDTSIEYIVTDKENVQAAHDNNLTIGRFGLYETLKYTNPEITVTSIKAMRIGELIRTRNREINNMENVNDELEEYKMMQHQNSFGGNYENGPADGSDGSVRRRTRNQSNPSLDISPSQDNTLDNATEAAEEPAGNPQEINTPEENGQKPDEAGSGQGGQKPDGAGTGQGGQNDTGGHSQNNDHDKGGSSESKGAR